MTKEELVSILQSLEISCNEGIQNMNNNSKLPRIVYFEYIWEPISSSGKEYKTLVTYQISFFSLNPRDQKLIQLKNKLIEHDIKPLITHEFLENTREFHSYFKLEVVENVN